MTVREEITVEEDGCVLETRQPAVQGSVRVWIGDHEMKEKFGNWLQMGPQSILFDSAIGSGNKIRIEYEVEA